MEVSLVNRVAQFSDEVNECENVGELFKNFKVSALSETDTQCMVITTDKSDNDETNTATKSTNFVLRSDPMSGHISLMKQTDQGLRRHSASGVNASGDPPVLAMYNKGDAVHAVEIAGDLVILARKCSLPAAGSSTDNENPFQILLGSSNDNKLDNLAAVEKLLQVVLDGGRFTQFGDKVRKDLARLNRATTAHIADLAERGELSHAGQQRNLSGDQKLMRRQSAHATRRPFNCSWHTTTGSQKDALDSARSRCSSPGGVFPNRSRPQAGSSQMASFFKGSFHSVLHHAHRRGSDCGGRVADPEDPRRWDPVDLA